MKTLIYECFSTRTNRCASIYIIYYILINKICIYIIYIRVSARVFF